jgi:hypothetical protein
MVKFAILLRSDLMKSFKMRRSFTVCLCEAVLTIRELVGISSAAGLNFQNRPNIASSGSKW